MLEAHHLVKRFYGTAVVDDVSFNVKPSEILGIAGVEGNGQTELIEALSGLARVTGGNVEFAGKDVTNRSARAISRSTVSLPDRSHSCSMVCMIGAASCASCAAPSRS